MEEVSLLPESWQSLLSVELEKDYYKKLQQFVASEYATRTVFPPKHLIFEAFNLCNPEQLKVVILGQDPYHGKGQAHGLSFSVPQGEKHPPSLRNIFKELHQDLGVAIPQSGNLASWATQGVLLLNATLTVREGEATSHQKKGWELFTDAVIQQINAHCKQVVFILWGNYAINKSSLIDEQKHLILKSVHPSPLSASRGFFGNHHFSKTNQYLKLVGKEPICW